jgi:hypothetical protein
VVDKSAFFIFIFDAFLYEEEFILRVVNDVGIQTDTGDPRLAYSTATATLPIGGRYVARYFLRVSNFLDLASVFLRSIEPHL